MTKKALWWLSIIFHRDWYVFFIIFSTANDKCYLMLYKLVTDIFFILLSTANDKRYLTLYKLVISITIIIIIINKLYATISGVTDENIDDVGNLHK